MGKKAAKSTRKFAASGQLKKTIQARKKHQEIQRKVKGKKSRKDAKGTQPTRDATAGDDEDEATDSAPSKHTGTRCVQFVVMNVCLG
jgi:nucleolar complex protein 2